MFRRFVITAPIALATVAAHAATGATPVTESAGSPFYVSCNDKRAESPAIAGNLEFTGILQGRDHVEVSLKNIATGRSEWVRLRDSGAAYFVESFDAGTRTIRVKLGGALIPIGLRAEVVNPFILRSSGEASAPDISPENSTPAEKPNREYTVVGPGGRSPDDPGLYD